MNELDLKIIKTICTDSVRGMEFANSYGKHLFNDEDARLFGDIALKYIRAYRAAPTRRTLTEWAGKAYENKITIVWDQMDQLDYPVQEYPFDLDLLKNRFAKTIRNEINNISSDDTAKDLKEIALRLHALRSIKEGKSFIQQTIKEHLPEFRENYEAKEKHLDNEVRVKTGYSAIDYCTGGFCPGELFLVSGATGMGKSMLLMNIAIQMWMQGNDITKPPSEFEKGYNIIFFSLEMPFKDMRNRFMARMANVPERSILDGILTPEEKQRIRLAEKFIEHYPYEFQIIDSPRGMTIDEMELRYEDAKLKFDPHVAIVDYLGLMHGVDEGQQQDWLKMGELSGSLHEFSRVHKIILGSALQLNDLQRGSKTDVKKEASHDVKVGSHRISRSSGILHHANFCGQIEDRTNEDSRDDLCFHIIKNRRGSKPKNVLLRKNFANSLITDIKYIPPEQRNLSHDDTSNENETLKPDLSSSLEENRKKIAAISSKIRNEEK